VSEVAESRIERVRREQRERLLGLFVDRSAEMALFQQVLDGDDLPVMVVTAESGMGKTALLMRMVHECALRKLPRAELEWTQVDVLDYLTTLRRLRDALGPEHFGAFTDLKNYYTDPTYQLRLQINVDLQGGSIRVAEGAQISHSQVGDIAGVVLRDNNFFVQRSDLSVPDDVRREQLTQRFLQGLATVQPRGRVVLFFNATEKMSEATYQWLWGQLLRPVVEGALPQVRAVLLGQRPLPGRDELGEIAGLLALAELKPLGIDDIDAYIDKRAPASLSLDAPMRRQLARMMLAATKGSPAAVSALMDQYLKDLA
jgi:hypothetical protein